MKERLSKQVCRILAIVAELHRGGQLSAEQLWERVGANCCKRTIRRDIKALVEMGYVREVRYSYLREGANAKRFFVRGVRFELCLSGLAGAVPASMRRKQDSRASRRTV